MPLAAGTQLGPYEVLSPLGAGGMGEVYRARDTRLARDVALKILPAEVASDASRRQRFEQEARAVAALNHPNIVGIYDVGEGYIVSELVDGESLRALKPGLRQAIEIGVQIADGLAAAHAAGITHRDLKPENIMLTHDGRVKILDFGLAKISGSRAPAAATQTLTVNTEPGVVMGTVGYMSPEQVRGQTADPRSDIFSFGLILYEMLAGKRAFTGDTSAETMTAILKQDAPDLPEPVPAPLRDIVAHCLEKNPANRFQSAKDLAFALAHSVSSSTTSAKLPAITVSSRRRSIWIAAAIMAIAAAAVAGHFLWRAPEPVEWTGTILGGPDTALNPRISPDGHLLAFEAMDAGMTQVAVMKPETGNWSILTHNRDRGMVWTINWSLDGSSIYYDRITDVFHGIYSVPVLGGEEHLILANAGIPTPLPDGSLLIVKVNNEHVQQYYRYWPETGRSVDLPISSQGTTSATQYTDARLLPGHKKAIIFARALSGVRQLGFFEIDLASNGVRSLNVPGLDPASLGEFAVSSDGLILGATRARGLVNVIAARPQNGAAMRTLFTTTSIVWSMDGGPDGSIFANLAERPADVIQLPGSSGEPERLASFATIPFVDLILALPDGRFVATAVVSGQDRLLVFKKGSEPALLVNTNEESTGPFSFAGPGRIVFAIGGEPHRTLAIAEIETGRIVQRISPGNGEIGSVTASPDGKTIYFAAAAAIWAISSSGGDPRRLTAGDSVLMEPSGASLIVQRPEPSGVHLFHLDLASGQETQIPLDPAMPLMDWPLSPTGIDAKGRLLLSLTAADSWFNPLAILDTKTGRMTRVPADPLSDHHTAAWTSDGHIVTIQEGLRAKLWKFTPRGLN